MPVMATGLAVPGLGKSNAPVAAVTLSTSPATCPVNAAPVVTSVAAVVPSSTLFCAVMPVTAVMLAGVMSAVVAAVVLKV